MADRVSPQIRSRMMSAVRNRNTAPELQVRSILHRSGFRFRLHARNLPGRPDIVLPIYRTVVFVHGCFWHGHDCPRGKRPLTNIKFWSAKIERNVARHRDVAAELARLGWTVVVVWECRLSVDLRPLLNFLRRRRARLPASPPDQDIPQKNEQVLAGRRYRSCEQ